MSDIQEFKISQIDDVIIVENRSDFRLKISIKPVKPKRKYITVGIVQPKGTLFTDKDGNFDLRKLSFTLDPINK